MKSLLTALSLLITCSAFAFEFNGKVIAVADGDTVTVLYNGNQQHKIRLLHIDCPESTQPFGTKAKTTLSGKIFGKTVTVKWTEMDKYKRILGDIYFGKRWINQEMVQEGMAWHYKFFSKDATIAAAETKAKASKLGVWSQANPVAPWDFRRGGGASNRGPPEKGTANTQVFITATGKKYHREGCRSLAKSKFASTLAKAKSAGLGPCKVCNPPQ
ncbi:MAG: thermonuclease family protein [Limisphaerales bacterium]